MADEKIRLLVVNKDGGGRNALLPALKVLREELGERLQVSVMVEGLPDNYDAWEKAGYRLFGGRPKKECFGPETGNRYDLEPEKVLRESDPHALLVSAGSPNNLEGGICREAIRQGRPVVILSDIYASSLRLNLALQCDLRKVLVTTIDEEDTRLTRAHFGERLKILETGSPVFDRFSDYHIEPSPRLEAISAGFPRVMYVLGQGSCTSDFLDGALAAADGSEEQCYVFVGLHPKFLENSELCKNWLARVRGSATPVGWVNKAATVHQYMRASGVLVTGYSTGALEAPFVPGGPVVVCWNSPLVQKEMASELGELTTFPTVTHGAALSVSSANELLEKVPPNRRSSGFTELRLKALDILKEKLHVDGQAAKRVAEAIREHAGIG